MLSIEEINAQIDEYEKKLKELKQLRITGYSFMQVFRISSEDHVNKLKGLTVKAEYEYNDHCHDEYGHDTSAYLKVTFGKNEYLEIDYKEAQGAGTESRYSPTIDLHTRFSVSSCVIIRSNSTLEYLSDLTLNLCWAVGGKVSILFNSLKIRSIER